MNLRATLHERVTSIMPPAMDTDIFYRTSTTYRLDATIFLRTRVLFIYMNMRKIEEIENLRKIEEK